MTTKATEKMIVKNIARAIRGNEKKIEQLRKLKERCVYLTSSDGIHITAELYEGNIARFIIEGTRSNMTVTVNTITNQIIRKPRGAEPWYTVQAFNMNVSDIEEEVKNMESWRLSDSLIEAVENDGIGYNEFMKEQEKINEKNASPFGLRACMDSVVSSVEMFGKNPLQMLKEYEQRAQEDVFFNKTMIEAVKQYIEEHELDGLTAEEFEDRAIRKEREQLILELMEDAKAISGKNADKWTRTKERDIFKRCDEWNESHYEQQEYGIFMCYQDRDSGDEFTGFCIEDDYFVTFPQEGAEEMTKEERKEAKREIRNMRHDVIEAYNGTETPTEAIEILVDERGYEGACEAVATVVNMVSPCDGRISHMVRKWANSIDGAYNNETCEALEMYFDCSHIHTAHVNQLGEAMKNYEPKEEEPSLSTYPLTDLGEVLETLDENKTVVVYANGSANAPEVARYDGRNSIPKELNSARVHHYAQDINAYYVYLEEMPAEPRTVDTCDLIHEIKNGLGDDAPTDISNICDYSETAYISDIFAEWADGETSIYYNDIIKYISEHVEAVNDAIEEFGWDGCGSDLYKAGQMAEYLEINNWLWEHETEAYKVYALNWFRFEHGEEIRKEEWGRFVCEVEQYGQMDRIGEAVEIMRQCLDDDREREVA